MRAALLVAVLMLGNSVCGCSTIDWKRSAHESLKDICKGEQNCYAMCPDGRRTDPSNPYCPGDLPQEQPEPF